MSSMTRLDTEKLRMRRIVATAAISVVAIAFLFLNDGFARGNAPLAGSTVQPLEVPANPGEMAQAPVEEAPTPALAAYGLPDAPPVEQRSLAEPGVAAEPEAPTPAASQQRAFKSRRALETIDPRDFLRQSAPPK